MYIHEAVQKAIEKDCGIRDTKSAFPQAVIKPTNTSNCCVIYENGQMISPRWNPMAKDLMSDGWELHDTDMQNSSPRSEQEQRSICVNDVSCVALVTLHVSLIALKKEIEGQFFSPEKVEALTEVVEVLSTYLEPIERRWLRI